MSSHDARSIAVAFALVLVMTAWGVWPRRRAVGEWLAERMNRWACSTWGHEYHFVERTDSGERWAVCHYCGARYRGW